MCGGEKVMDGSHMRKVRPAQTCLPDFWGYAEHSKDKMFPLEAVTFKSYLRRGRSVTPNYPLLFELTEHRQVKQLWSCFQAIPAFQEKYGKYLRNKYEEITGIFQKHSSDWLKEFNITTLSTCK